METPLFIVKSHKPQGKCGGCGRRIHPRDSYWKWRKGRYGGYEVRCAACGPSEEHVNAES